jgi:trehalose/maltose hydrolase-like predicted phosphorylase
MYPTILLFYPEIAKSILRYRSKRVDTAQEKAKSYGKNYKGAMFPC